MNFAPKQFNASPWDTLHEREQIVAGYMACFIAMIGLVLTFVAIAYAGYVAKGGTWPW